jgi:hypothetical protein
MLQGRSCISSFRLHSHSERIFTLTLNVYYERDGDYEASSSNNDMDIHQPEERVS